MSPERCNFQGVGEGVTAAVVADGSATYTPGISERRSGTTKYLHAGLKNADLQTSSSQTNAGTRRYDAFGNVVGGIGSYGGPFGYAGKFGYQSSEDAEVMLLGHRYYDPSTGRFLTRDPIKDGRNWYVYCEGSPNRRADPTGLVPWGRFGVVTQIENQSNEWITVVGDYWLGGKDRTGALLIPPGGKSHPRFDVDEAYVPSTGYWEPHNFPISWNVGMIVRPNGIVVTESFGDWMEPTAGRGGGYPALHASPMTLSQFDAIMFRQPSPPTGPPGIGLGPGERRYKNPSNWLEG